jgi:hypothetical protein
MLQDAEFAAAVCRSEAGAELNHMRNIQQAAKDEKNWRASVWWLERRSPERYGPRGAGVVTARQIKAFVEILADVLREDVRDAEERQQILARLNTLAGSVDQMLRDNQLNLSDVPTTAEATTVTPAGDRLSDALTDDGASANHYGP